VNRSGDGFQQQGTQQHRRIDAARCGPPSSANGGWTAGLLADALLNALGRTAALPVTVNLHLPPPLEVDMSLQLDGHGAETRARLLAAADPTGAEQAVVATAVSEGTASLAPVPPVHVAVAAAASRRYAGADAHPFPSCFVCGTARADGDGLCLRPGRVDGGRTACTWTPHRNFAGADGTLDAAYVWAALDCPGGWTTNLVGRPMVLVRMTALVHRRPAVGEELVVVGQHLDTEGRKTHAATTAYDSGGGIVGRARHLWVSVDPAAFG